MLRRLLLLALLTVLPLQFSWAAVAVYCLHEAQPKVQHVGHHEHRHAGDHVASADVEDNGDNSKALGSIDFDCGHCHGACFSLPTRWAPLPSPTPVGQTPADTTRAVPHRATAPPERPQWACLA